MKHRVQKIARMCNLTRLLPAAILLGILPLAFQSWDLIKTGPGAAVSKGRPVYHFPNFVPPVFAGPPDVCSNEGLQTGLGGGSPTGGVYSGPGVTDNGNGTTFSFNPAVAGVGTHIITYTLLGESACSQITVHLAPDALTGQTIDACVAGSTEIAPTPGTGCTSQEVLFIESFETDGEGTRYDATLNTLTGTADAYFARARDVDINVDYNGEVGSYYWTGEDHDNNTVGVGDPSLQIDFSAGGNTADIVGKTGVVFKGLFAANPNSPFSPTGSGADVGEPDSYLRVDYQIDAGLWTPALQFSRSASGTGLSLDTDFDGVGDCDLLTRDFKEFSFPIPNPGPDFKLRIFMHSDETGEEYAIDNFGIYADGPPNCLFNFYDADPGAGPATLLAGPTSAYDPGTTSANSPQSVWVTQVNDYGCESEAAEFIVEVSEETVTLNLPELNLCISDDPVSGLSGGLPAGGVYSGTGVTDNGGTFTFDPSAAGPTGGNITVTYTVAGSCSEAATDNILVTELCCPLPVASCVAGPLMVVLDGDGNGSLTVAEVDAGSTAGCGLQSISLSPSTFNCTNLGLQTVTLTITDTNGDSDDCTTQVEVKDLEFPTLDCPDDVSFNNQNNICGVGIDVPVPVADDNCPLVALEARYRMVDELGVGISAWSFYSNNPSGFYAVGRWEVEWRAVDPAGNTTSCNFYMEVNDTQNPTISCAAIDGVRIADAGSCDFTMPGVGFDPTFSDNCPAGTTISNDYNNDNTLAGATFPVGTTPVIWTVTDAGGNTATCSFNVEVTDAEDPTAVCQDVTVLLNSAGIGSTNVALVDNGSSDACGIGSLSLDVSDFTCADVGPNTVTLTVTDANGNSATCTATVTVTDIADPTPVCQGLTVQLDANGNASVTAAQVGGNSFDACGIALLELDQTDFSCADVGANIVTLTVTDINGNTEICTATVTVADDDNPCCAAPEAFCQDVTVFLNSSGLAAITANDVNNGSTADCGLQSLGIDISSFNCSNVGTPVVVTLTITDLNNNTSTCESTVTVLDESDPTAVCQDVTVLLNSLGIGSTNVALVDNGSSDACGIGSLSLDVSDFTCADVGPNTVILTVTDVNGNTSTCSATATVTDIADPTPVCQGLTVQLDANGNASVTAAQVGGNSFDACGIASLELDQTDFNCADVGANIVTLTVTDINGNSEICTATVTVADDDNPCCPAPQAFCQDLTVSLDGDGNASITAGEVDNGSTAGCGLESLGIDISSFNCSNVGTPVIVTLTVTDINGGTSTCESTVTVLDETDPTAVCQDVTVQLNGAGTGSTTAAAANNGSSDACGIESISLSQTTFGCADIGLNAETLTVTDVNGNTSTCSVTVTVEDNVDPTAVCQDVTVQLDANGNGSTTVAAVNGGAQDGCGIDDLSLSQTNFDCGDVGANTVTLTVTDVNGNTSTCSATVTVEDNVDPTAVCQDVTVQLNAAGTGSTTAAAANNGSSDACGIESISLSQTTFGCAEVGDNPETLTVTDVNGNTSTCSVTVTVEDNVDPTAGCQDFTVTLDENNLASVSPEDINDDSSDACGIESLSLDRTSFDCTDIGDVTVVLTVTDVNGNTSTCSATVTVNQGITPCCVGPEALCKDIDVLLDTDGTATITAANVDNGSTAECGLESMEIDISSFDCDDIGTPVTVTLTVTDNNAETSSCESTVTVLDEAGPTALCQNVTVFLDAEGNGLTTATAVDNNSTDACGLASIGLNQTKFDCADVGSVMVTLTATDVNGNTSTCSASVTVVDDMDPEVDCTDVTVALNGEGSIQLDAEALADASDNCGIASIETDQVSISCTTLGQVVPVTVTVSDPSGNTASCIANVTVVGMPCGWMEMPDGIGCTNGSEGSYDESTETFNLTASGCYTPSATADESGFIKYQLCGDGSITAHVAGLTLPGFAGIVMRESDAPGAKKVAIAYQGTNALARYVRYITNGASFPSYINTPGSRWLRIVRTGNLFKGYHSPNGVTWIYAFTVTVPMNSCIQVGLIAWGTNSGSVVTASFDDVVINPPYSNGPLRPASGNEVPVEFETALPSLELWPNPTNGISTLNLDRGWGEDVTVEVMDEFGRQVKTLAADATLDPLINLDLSDQPQGLYMLRVKGSEGRVSVRKLIITR